MPFQSRKIEIQIDPCRNAYQAGTGTHKGEGPISGILLYFAMCNLHQSGLVCGQDAI